MKVAIDISQVVYEGTGVATYTRELVRHILAVDAVSTYVLFGSSLRKRQVLGAYFSSLRSAFRNVEGKFFWLPQSAMNVLGNTFHRIPVETFAGAIDVYHSSDWIQFPSRAKKVTTLHDMVVSRYPSTSHPQIVATQKRRMHWVAGECDAILCDSRTTQRDAQFFLHIPSDRLHIVSPGISETFRPVSRAEIETVNTRFGFRRPYILTVGTLEPRKNLSTVLSAFRIFLSHPHIASLPSPVSLVVVGKKGWGEDMPFASHVYPLGYVSNSDLTALYSGATAFVFASYYEGFGFPILEAMACGCPVLSSDRGSLGEIGGEAVEHINANDPNDIARRLVALFSDSEKQKELSEKGKIHARKFSWNKTAENAVSIYRALTR